MSILLIPALISLLFKLFVLAHVLKGGKVSAVFLSLIVIFAIHNAIEAFGYMQFISGNIQTATIMFRLYYVATIYLLLYIFLHGLNASTLENHYTTTTLVSVATLISILILFTDFIVAGQYRISYSWTAIKGDGYWLFSSFLIISLLSTLFTLVYGLQTAKTQLKATRCKYSLYALTPVLMSYASAITFKLMSLNVNATGIIPVATTLFLFIVLKTESKHKLSDIRRLLPLSLERKTADGFLTLLDTYVNNSNKDSAYKDLQHGFEKEVILYSLKKCNNNIAQTAKLMGIRNPSTLYAMINRLNIDVQELKGKNNTQSFTEDRQTHSSKSI